MTQPNQMTPISDGLWANARDSIKHALDHFCERGQPRGDRGHHDKWIVLSVHHAAECICNMRLIDLEPNNPLLSKRGSPWFPSLTQTLGELQAPRNEARLSPAEHQLFVLMRGLPDIRNELMHRTAPAGLDVSIAAMCMVGMLKYIERVRGETASDIVWQSPPIEGDVVAAIRSIQEYSNFVELFVREKYGDRWLPACPACGVRAVESAVMSAVCEACFTELGSVECKECGEPTYYVELKYEMEGTARVECECGATQDIRKFGTAREQSS
jgi:hypothetical protein